MDQMNFTGLCRALNNAAITNTKNVRCCVSSVMYTNIDLKLRNKTHGPKHYKIGVTCVYNGHGLYTQL